MFPFSTDFETRLIVRLREHQVNRDRVFKGIMLVDLAILIASYAFWPRQGYGCEAGDVVGCFVASLDRKDLIPCFLIAVALGSVGLFTMLTEEAKTNSQHTPNRSSSSSGREIEID